MEQNNNNKRPGDKKPRGNVWITLLLTAGIVFLIVFLFNTIRSSKYEEASFSEFMAAMEENNLAEVELYGDRIIYMTREDAAKPSSEQQAYFTGMPDGSDTMALATRRR